MGMTNQELINKATITTAALANGGKLSAQQANTILDFVVDETSMQDKVRVVRFDSEETLIDKMSVGTRVAVPKEEAVDPGVRRSISTSKVSLTPKEIMVPFTIGDLTQDHSIEPKNLKNHILRMFGAQLANNIETLAWNGNDNGPGVLEDEIVDGGSSTQFRKDTYLALFDGWLKGAEGGTVVDAQNAAISQLIFGKAMRAMPNKFKKNKSRLRWIMSMDHDEAYLEGISARGTNLGDNAVNGMANPKPHGVERLPVALLEGNPIYSEDITNNTDGTTPSALAFAPVTALNVCTQTLGKTPESAFILATDYSNDLANGTVTRLGGGSIGSGAVTKVSYRTAGKMLLCDPKNMILAIARDSIKIERARNIFAGVDEFAISAKVFATFEELTAVVLVKNILVPT